MTGKPEELKDASLDKTVGGMGDTGTHEVGHIYAANLGNGTVPTNKPRNNETASKLP